MKKKIIIFTSLVLMIVTFSMIGTTLSRYRSEASVNASGDIASWEIKVNNTEITGGTVKTFAVTPTIIPSGDVLDGTAAPGSFSYADIIVDVSEVDVSYSVDLEAYIPGKTHTTHPAFSYINLNGLNENNIDSNLNFTAVRIATLPTAGEDFVNATYRGTNTGYYMNITSQFKLNKDSSSMNEYKFIYDTTTSNESFTSSNINVMNIDSKDYVKYRLYFENSSSNNTLDTASGNAAAKGTTISDKVYIALSFKQWVHA